MKPVTAVSVLALTGAGLLMSACGSGGSSSGPVTPPSGDASSSSVSSAASSVSSRSSSSQSSASAGRITINQLGFAPAARKVAVVPQVDATTFTVIDATNETEVMSAELGAFGHWDPADQTVALADFSELQTPGEYKVRVAGATDSDPFTVGAAPYRALNAGALKAYYFNRASTALTEEYAGPWARAAGHPDTEVLVHASAASDARPEGTVISAPKGWYDAGDFGKYIVNSGISTYTLLAALEHYPDFYAGQDVDIPESGDAVPDILDEALWNLEWMLDMQDPNDGGVYHKLTTKNFAGAVMPASGTATRYVVQKGTAAALNFAAVMATASRVLDDYEAYTELSATMLQAARDAWAWAEANPDVPYEQPSDVSTGAYGDGNFTDEFAWAAAELYITTGEDSFYQAMAEQSAGINVPGWANTAALSWMSLAAHQSSLTEAADDALIESRITSLADTILAEGEASAYGVSMTSGDFYWGSNSAALNRAMMLIQGYRLTGNADYMDAAQSLMDYILGRNPTEYSYVTGFGERPPMHIHHRQSEADTVEAPVPGFVAGGPNTDAPNDCEPANPYPAGNEAEARAYLDHWCSYSTNEVTINWNAPLVYVTGALETYYGE